jgi:hypothetical protein
MRADALVSHRLRLHLITRPDGASRHPFADPDIYPCRALGERPASVYAMTAITISLRVTAPGPAVARVSVGRRQFSIGRPVEFDDASPHVAALEYALGAVGGEVVNGLREFARRRRLALDAVEALVTGELQDGLAYLEVIGESGRPRLGRIAIKVFIASPDVTATGVLFDEMLERLPLVSTLREALDLDIELVQTS